MPRMSGWRSAVGAGLLFFSTGPAWADGGFFYPRYGFVTEPMQEALIVYDAASHTQDLVLHVRFQGDTRDFAWIVPVPAAPALESANVLLFQDCRELTSPVWREGSHGFACSDGGSAIPMDADGGVDIYDEQLVGIYRTLTLGAGEAGPLADSLEAWGYLHNANRAETEAALQYYIDKSWAFVAMRIDSAAVEERDPYGYWWGYLQPIRLTFPTERIVYPMRISALSASEQVSVTLYVCAQHRMTFPGAEAEYANLLNARELAEAKQRCDRLAPFLSENCFVTRLSGDLRASDMTEDLAIVQAPDDREFIRINYSGMVDGGFLSCGLVAAAFLLKTWTRRGRQGTR
jgi:hypothetical protein